MPRVVLIVLDSLGCGAMPDAAAFGDSLDCNTLGNLAKAVGGVKLPNLERLGIGSITPIAGVNKAYKPTGFFGRLREASRSKDTTAGHWELMGIVSEKGFPTFPNGFPPEIMEPFARLTGFDYLWNKPASGTEILQRLGEEHLRTGKLIVYTSADSVLQIAAHEQKVPLAELYRACEIARKILDPWNVGRVIARPFVGNSAADFKRTYNRKDFSLLPPQATVLDELKKAGKEVVGVGKIGDIFAGQGLTRSVHSAGNADGLAHTLAELKTMREGLLFTNLVDFDMLYGHRRDAKGYARALEETDAFLPQILKELRAEDLLLLVADHGNDPTFLKTTDHTREYVPLLAYVPGKLPGGPLGTRKTFADVGQTVAVWLGLDPLPELSGEVILELFT